MTAPLISSDEWYAQTIHYFREMGFFSNHAELAREELVEQVKRDSMDYWGTDLFTLATTLQAADLFLLTTDSRRVWHRDLECAYCGEESYPETLREWSLISRGAFEPSAISETWHGQGKIANVEFTLNGRRHRFVHEGGDILDINIICTINRLLDGEHRLEVCDTFGMPNIVLALDADEKARLIQQRKWQFWTDAVC